MSNINSILSAIKSKKLKRSKLVNKTITERLLRSLASALPIACLVIVGIFILNPNIPINTLADTGTVNVNYTAPTINIATNTDAVYLNINPSATGTMSSGYLIANVTTNNLSGYYLTINTTPKNSGTAGNLTSAAGQALHPSTGTIATPTVFSASNCNAWGFAVSGGNTGISSGWNNSYVTQSNVAVNSSGNTYNFAAVPTVDTMIFNNTNNTSNLSAETDIYFGACAGGSNGIPSSGDYTATVTLTAVINTPPDSLPVTPPASLPSVASAVDVTPTTGWAGDTIYITGTGNFTGITDVTVGGLPCTPFMVNSPGLISCVLPTQAAGSVNSIAVIQGYVTNLTPSTTYNNMNITYFDPSRTVTIGATASTHIYFNNPDSSVNFTSTDCGNMTLNQVIDLTDYRNGQTYPVKKMTANSNGGRCWMADNLKFATGEYGTVGQYLTVDGTNATGTNYNISKYINPQSQSYCYGTTSIPAGSLTRCGYLYNWYSATYGTGNSAVTTNYTNVYGSICPNNTADGNATSSPWQIPTGLQSASASGQYAWLNALMNNQGASAASVTNTTGFYQNWQPTGAWLGAYSGVYANSFSVQGSYGEYWSSTAGASLGAALYAYQMYFNVGSVLPGNNNATLNSGFAVRCLMP